MERNIFLSVLLLTIVVLAVAMLLPSGKQEIPSAGDSPWNVTVDKDGYSHVFGISVGRSTVGEVAQLVQDPGEVSMFVSADNKRTVEVYFDRVVLGLFNAKMVLGVALDDATLKGMYERGARISSLAGGVRKVELQPDDLARVDKAAISSLTYLPSVNLDVATVKKRFGEPAQRFRERKSGLEHWLYPAIGLDLTLNEKDKDVLVYVKPSDFEKVMAPLKENADEISNP